MQLLEDAKKKKSWSYRLGWVGDALGVRLIPLLSENMRAKPVCQLCPM